MDTIVAWNQKCSLCHTPSIFLFNLLRNSEGSWKTDIMKDKVGHSVVTNLVCSLDINLDGRALGYIREV